MAVFDVELVYGGVVANLHAQLLCTSEIGIHEGFAAAHKKCIGACHVQSA